MGPLELRSAQGQCLPPEESDGPFLSGLRLQVPLGRAGRKRGGVFLGGSRLALKGTQSPFLQGIWACKRAGVLESAEGSWLPALGTGSGFCSLSPEAPTHPDESRKNAVDAHLFPFWGCRDQLVDAANLQQADCFESAAHWGLEMLWGLGKESAEKSIEM